MSLNDAVKELLDAGLTTDDILCRVLAIATIWNNARFNESELENRNYTYVSVMIKYLDGIKPEEFIVSSPFKRQAKTLAEKYVAKQGWELMGWNDGKKGYFRMYPRNYINDAKRLFKENKYI